MRSLRRKNKRPMLLLEVLIAFAIVVLCALPLMAPHYAMLRDQSRYQKHLVLDHTVNLLFGDIVQQLYLNQFSWEELQNKQHPVSLKMLAEAGMDPKNFPYKGFFIFSPLKSKSNPSQTESAHVYNLKFVFTPNHGERVEYDYDLFIARMLS